MTQEEAWTRALETVGGLAAMGRHLGITRQRLFKWKICKAEYVLPVERAVRRAMRRRPVTKHDLRPDLYPNVRKTLKTKGE